jgi:DNA-binding CsgD family transcriptional regulator
MTEALLLKSEGYARKEIAARMGISEERVKEHLAEGMKRLKRTRLA